MTVHLLLLSLVTWPCRGIHAEDNFHFTPHCKSQSMDNCCTSPMILLVNCLCYKSFLNCILHGDCQQHSYMSSSYRSNMVEWFWWDSSLISTTNWFHCFDTVGLVIWPVKIVPEMTCIVLSGTLSLYTTTAVHFVGSSYYVSIWPLVCEV